MKLKRVSNLNWLPEYSKEIDFNKDMSHSSYFLFETNQEGTEIKQFVKFKDLGETDEDCKIAYSKLIDNIPEGIVCQTVGRYNFDTNKEFFVKRYFAIYKNVEHSMFKPIANGSISSGNMTPAKLTVELYFYFDGFHRYVTKEFKTRNCNIWTLVDSTLDNYEQELPIKHFKEKDSPEGYEGDFILCYDEFYNEQWICIERDYEIKDALVSFRLVDVSYEYKDGE